MTTTLPWSAERSHGLHRVTMVVSGMTGPRCAASVASALSLIRGVSEVEVSCKDGRASLSIDPQKAEAAQLRTAVTAVGYSVLVFEETPPQSALVADQAAA